MTAYTDTICDTCSRHRGLDGPWLTITVSDGQTTQTADACSPECVATATRWAVENLTGKVLSDA